MRPIREQHVRNMGVAQKAFTVRLRNLEEVGDLHGFMAQAFDTMMDRAFEGAAAQDRVGVQINHPGLNRVIMVPFRRRDQLSAEAIISRVEAVAQSRTDFEIDEQMEIQFTRVRAAGLGGG